MEEKEFIDRTEEIATIGRSLQRKGPELIILYGRRRIGKSRLLQEVGRKFHLDLSIMLEDADYGTNVKKAASAVSTIFKLPSFNPQNFKEIFQALPDGAVIALDEFSYISGAIGEFQAIWEEIAKPKRLKVILCGSFIRVMEDLNFSLTSPLYGRATTILKLTALQFSHVREWYGDRALLEKVLISYFVVGGVPRYLEILERPGMEEIKNDFFSKNSLLLREGKLLLKEHFPSSTLIPKILAAVSSGITSATLIANAVQVKSSEISKYLAILVEYGYVERRSPICGGGKKDTRFFPNDRFFAFWTRFVWPFYNDIEAGIYAPAITALDRDFNIACGLEFERFVLELLQTTKILGDRGYTTIGRQWGRIPPKLEPPRDKNTYEIDICGLDYPAKKILFGECKWRENVEPQDILPVLLQKTSYVSWQLGDRVEELVIVAKSFTRKVTEFKSCRVSCIDFDTIARFI